jgi:hypothetical protein
MEDNLNKDQMLFTNLIIMFQSAAMQHMGKIKNPITDTIERDLEQARISIDLLEMIEKKTKGNLDAYEKKILQSVLQELRLNYVYERDRRDEPEAEKRETDTTEKGETGQSSGTKEDES